MKFNKIFENEFWQCMYLRDYIDRLQSFIDVEQRKLYSGKERKVEKEIPIIDADLNSIIIHNLIMRKELTELAGYYYQIGVFKIDVLNEVMQ